jgi:hypothetical protein
LRLHYGNIAAAFLNCGCITCISVQQNFEVLTPRLAYENRLVIRVV